jgi:hypothetical protein
MIGDDIIFTTFEKAPKELPGKIIGPPVDDPDSLEKRDLGVFARTGYTSVLGSSHSARPLPGTWRYRDE